MRNAVLAGLLALGCAMPSWSRALGPAEWEGGERDTTRVRGVPGDASRVAADDTAATPGVTTSKTVYYVSRDSKSADWPGARNRNTPCTPHAAMTNAVAGDTVLFLPGTYDVGHPPASANYRISSLVPRNSGEPDRPIVFAAETPGTVVLEKAAPLDDFTSGRYVNARGIVGTHFNSHLVFDGFTVKMQATTSPNLSGIYLQDSTNVVVRRCTVLGIDIGGVPSVPDRFHPGHNHQGIWIERCDNAVIQDCVVQDVLSLNPESGEANHNSSGIKLYNTRRTTIEHCRFENNAVGIFDKVHGSLGLVVRRNVFKNSHPMHIYTGQHPWEDASIYENIFVNGQALEVGDHGVFARDLQFYSNTVLVDRDYATNMSGGIVEVCNGGSNSEPTSNFQCWNNVIVNRYAKRPVGSLSLVERGTPFDLSYCDYNAYRPFAVVFNRYSASERSYADLNTWRKATGHDQKSHDADPRFVDEVAFRLAANSPLKRAGRDGVDIGAYPRGDATVIGPRPPRAGDKGAFRGVPGR